MQPGKRLKLPQRLWVGQRRGVFDGPPVNRLAHGELGFLDARSECVLQPRRLPFSQAEGFPLSGGCWDN